MVVFSISSVAFEDENAKIANKGNVSLTEKNPEANRFPHHGENSFPAGQQNVPFWSFLFASECTQLRNQSHIHVPMGIYIVFEISENCYKWFCFFHVYLEAENPGDFEKFLK